MPIQHAVLALLDRGPSYGYELKAQFETSVGPQWGELNIGHLYQVLERLVRDDLVERAVVAQSDRPDKNVYSLTDEGHDELGRWLEQPFVRQSGYRDDFFLKLFAAARLGETRLRTLLKVQREAYLGELAALWQLRSQQSDPVVGLLIHAAILHTEANLKVVDEAAVSASELVDQNKADAQPAAAAGEPRAGEAPAVQPDSTAASSPHRDS
jgi:DNA-binding PadR family transcriptional regulator